MDMKGRVVIVTGAGRGIGRALAREFAHAGAKVVCTARTMSDVAETVRLIEAEGGAGWALSVDVGKPESVQAMVDAVMRRYGRVDVLFNNAARIPVIAGLWEVDAEAWWEELTVNLRGPMLCTRAVLPQMMQRHEGVIINMTGGTGIPGRTSYCCSKAAINKLTELLAKEMARVGSGVVVFAMGPGLVKTKRTRHEAESAEGQKWNPGTRDAFAAGEDRPPEDCARATLQLLRGDARALHGKTFSAQEVLAGAK